MNLEAYKAVDALVDRYNLDLPEAYKRRDPKEPGREIKESYEDQMMMTVKRRFNTQARQIRKKLERILPQKQENRADAYLSMLSAEDFKDPKNEKKILKIFLGIVSSGIELFAETQTLQVDWTQVNEEAAEWAREWKTEFLKDIDDTTRDRIKQELVQFVEEPAYTLGDVMSGLKEVGFDEARAQMTAVTEVTRTFAEAELKSGQALAKEFPDVEVVKTWFTNNDSLVCVLCGPLHGKEVLVDEKFAEARNWDGMAPPRHPRCRCWHQTRTRI